MTRFKVLAGAVFALAFDKRCSRLPSEYGATAYRDAKRRFSHRIVAKVMPDATDTSTARSTR